MKRILLTGMSGTGKSSVTAALAKRGYKAVDADGDEYSEWVEVADSSAAGLPPLAAGRDWMWRADRMGALLATEDTPVLFVSGCAENMGQFLPQFDHIILLRAPNAVLVERLRTRTTNQYGKGPGEVEQVLDFVERVEPLLRRVASHEIDTSAPLDEVVAAVLRIAGGE